MNKIPLKDNIFIGLIGIWTRLERMGKNLKRKDLSLMARFKRIWWGY